MLRPRIGRQAVGDLGDVRGTHDEQDITRAFERTTEGGELIVDESLHERRLRRPVDLMLIGRASSQDGPRERMTAKSRFTPPSS